MEGMGCHEDEEVSDDSCIVLSSDDSSLKKVKMKWPEVVRGAVDGQEGEDVAETKEYPKSKCASVDFSYLANVFAPKRDTIEATDSSSSSFASEQFSNSEDEAKSGKLQMSQIGQDTIEGKTSTEAETTKQKLAKLLTEKRRLRCDLCRNNFSRESYRRVHRPCYFSKCNVSPESPQFQCDFCSKQYTTLRSLRRHLTLHVDREQDKMQLKPRQMLGWHALQCVKMLRCRWPGCGYKCSARGYLQVHLMGHRKKKAFKCTRFGCCLGFVTRYEKIRHQLLCHFKQNQFDARLSQ